jgi:hypothetical protein
MFKKFLLFVSAIILLASVPGSVLAASSITSVSIGSQSKTPVFGSATTSISYIVTVNRTGNGSLTVNFSTSSMPTGVTSSFSPLTRSFTGNTPTSATTTLTLSTSALTPAGLNNFTVLAGDGSVTASTTGTLNVSDAVPVITLSSNLSTSTPTNQDITITATTTAGILNATSHIFTSNGTFSFVANNNGVISTSTITITNIDKEAPVLATGSDITNVEATSPSGAPVTYTNPTATDNNPSPTVTCLPTSGSTFSLGTTGVICNATDAAGNAATSTTFNVTVVDTTAPVIVITGANPQTVQAGVAFSDLGAVAQDVVGDFAASSTNNVDTNAFGSYTVVYTATDAAGNVAASTTRTVNVVDTTAPAVPTVVSPVSNSTHNTSSLTTFDWNDVTDFSSPVTYSFQLATVNTLNPNKLKSCRSRRRPIKTA